MASAAACIPPFITSRSITPTMACMASAEDSTLLMWCDSEAEASRVCKDDRSRSSCNILPYKSKLEKALLRGLR